jgi:hypothetical protein
VLVQSTPALEPTTELPEERVHYMGLPSLADVFYRDVLAPSAVCEEKCEAEAWLEACASSAGKSDEGGVAFNRDLVPVVYVSTGSRVELQRWQVHALAEGLLCTGWRVIWSLRQPKLLPSGVLENPLFLVRPWLPERKLLRHPAVRLAVSHAGWGTLGELAHAGKAFVCLPLDGDQLLAAQLMQTHGVGKLLVHTLGGEFTAEGVHAALLSVAEDSSYATAAGQLRGKMEKEWFADKMNWPMGVSSLIEEYVRLAQQDLERMRPEEG